MRFQPRQRFLDHRALLAEGKAHIDVGRAAPKKTLSGISRHARLAHQRSQKARSFSLVRAVDAGGEKIGAFAGQHIEAEFRQAPAPADRGCPEAAAQAPAENPSRAPRPWATPSCSAGGVVKVRNWCALAITSISARGPVTQPTFQPVSEKIFPAEPIRTTRSRMPGKRGQRNMRPAVIGEMLIDFVADRHRVRCSHSTRASAAISSRVEHPADGIERRVDQHRAGLGRDRRGQRLFRQPPVGRRQA